MRLIGILAMVGIMSTIVTIVFVLYKIVEFFYPSDDVIKTKSKPQISWEVKISSDNKIADTVYIYTFKK